MKKIVNLFSCGFLVLGLASCEAWVDTKLRSNELAESDALLTKEDILEVLQSAYDVNANFYDGDVQNLNELLGDNLELQNNSGDLAQVYNHNVSIFNGTTAGIYGEPYISTFRANRILERIDDFDFSATDKERITAEAKFLRAMGLFDVLRLWAQPYGYTADNSHPGIVYKTNTEVEIIPRPAVADNYQSIISDLEEVIASTALPLTSEYYASQDAAKALLAEVYFQMGDYRKAADMATDVIAADRYALGNFLNRFQPDTVMVPEVIFKTRSYSITGINDFRSTSFTNNYRSDLNADPFFRADFSFFLEYAADTNDLRILEFFELRNANEPDRYVAVTKFNKPYFDVPILHLTRLKLIRAESLALLGDDLPTAIADINDIRARAYADGNELAATAGASTVLEAVRHERRIEMFGEGDRVQQLKRYGAQEGEEVLIRGDRWDCNGMIIQFPSTERTEEFKLNPQGGC